ncbi:MAG: ATP-binding protein [Chryseolinea sp.]
MRKSREALAGKSERRSANWFSTEKPFNKTLDWPMEGIQIIDFNWRYLFVNDSLTGDEKKTMNELLGHSMTERYPNLENTALFSALEQCMNDRMNKQVEIEFVDHDKSKKWYELNIEPVEEGILVLTLDITSRKEADKKLKRVQHFYAFISQINQNIVRVKDEATLFRNACHMAIEFGKFKMAWIGKFSTDNKTISLVDHCGIPTEEIQPFFSNASPQSLGPQEYVLQNETHYICNDIEHDPVLEIWKPYADRHDIRSCMVLPLKKSGKVIGTFNLYSNERDFSEKEEMVLLVEVAADISFALDLFEKEKRSQENILERKRAEEKLMNNNEELKKTNSELDRFVYSASHDLRAPLCSVLGLVSLIEMDSKESSTLEYARLIKNSVNKLDGFILNILNYSKNNRLEVEAKVIPVQQTISEIVSSLRNMKQAQDIRFEVDIHEQDPFYSDDHRFSIVVENLISNAIKFQDHSKALKFIKISGKSDAENLRLQIEDNGIGIAHEFQNKIFDMFFRISGQRDGSGIGLYIVKETVEKMHGSIEVDSIKNEGTTFHIRLKNMIP